MNFSEKQVDASKAKQSELEAEIKVQDTEYRSLQTKFDMKFQELVDAKTQILELKEASAVLQ